MHIVVTAHTHTHPFNGPLSGSTRVGRYQKGKTNLDFTEARDSEWQWHQLDRMQVCTSLQTDNHASTPPLSFLQAGCPYCCPTNSIKALKANCSYSSYSLFVHVNGMWWLVLVVTVFGHMAELQSRLVLKWVTASTLTVGHFIFCRDQSVKI